MVDVEDDDEDSEDVSERSLPWGCDPHNTQNFHPVKAYGIRIVKCVTPYSAA